MNKKTWYTTKLNEKNEEVIDRIQILREGENPLPANKNWKLSPTNNVLYEETPIARYDENMRYLEDDEWLKKQGRKDLPGCWYSKTKTGETMLIYSIEETVDESEWTQTAPLENEPYQKFDKAKNKWVVDTQKKERAEKENRLGKLKSEIEDAEQRQIRPMKAIIKNEATEYDTNTFNKYEEIIQELRPQVTVLENELKSA
jgi:hypothetical protein